MGVSTKVVNFIESVYRSTKTAVWTGSRVSEYFETFTGVKQGCLLSPTLFTLYLNDLHEYLEGGLMIDDINVRLLMYADDIVLLSDNLDTMKNMVKRLENYCERWNMEVNMSKSELIIFRTGGKLSSRETLFFKSEPIKIVNEYKYLGVTMTPRLSFKKHIEKRNISSKNCINSTWKSFLNKPDINIGSKWKLFQSVCRSIQSYSAEVWGFGLFDEIDKLQRYFLKRILKLPDFTPNYCLLLETGAECSYFYTLNLHLNYIYKTLFQYPQNRLPHKLSKIALREKIFWVKHLNDIGDDLGVALENENISALDFRQYGATLLRELKAKVFLQMNFAVHNSRTRFYKNLDHSVGQIYIFNAKNTKQITTIFKTRCDLLPLNANNFSIESKTCSICNTGEDENLYHFMAKCPIYKQYRNRYFGKDYLTENELKIILDGQIFNAWDILYNYVNSALKYRNLIIQEYN